MATRIFSSVPAAISCPWPLIERQQSAAWAARSHTTSVRRQAYGSGAVGLTSKDFLGYATLLACNLNKSCATQVLARESLSSLLLLVHIVLLQIALAQMQIVLTWRDPMRSSSLWINLQNGAGAGTFKPLSPIMKPAPKRLRTLLIPKPIRAICRDFCLPGVS